MEGGHAPSAKAMTGLFFIQRYRYLSTQQFASASGLRYGHAAETLLKFERSKLLGHFGNVGMRGYGKTPKVYFLTERGHRVLRDESGIPDDLIGDFKAVHVTVKWSPVMFHRMATLDLLIALEVATRDRPAIELAETFIEYRRKKRGAVWEPETTDYVVGEEIPEHRIVPDAGFIIENVESGARALFFIEVDMGTERITSTLPRGRAFSIHHKMTQYDRYLMGGRFSETYSPWGAFKFFTLLFITTTAARRDNMRREMSNLPKELHPYYRFNVMETVLVDFFNDEWCARSITDDTGYRLIREA